MKGKKKTNKENKNKFFQQNKNKINIYKPKNENLQKSNEDSKAEKKKKDIEEENKFRFSLLKKDLGLHLIKRDGNCLFSSISDQVYGTDKHSDIIREKCMDYIEKNSLFFSKFIEGGETQMPAYIKRKRKKGIWGDNLEIQALSEIYNRPIEIYTNINKPISSFSNDKFNKRYPIKISYHGNKHYNSIVPLVKHKDYPLYKNELLNNNSPGIYETNFIKNYDVSQKLKENIENFNEQIKFDEKNDSFDENDFLYQDAIENSKNDFNGVTKDLNNNHISDDNNINRMKNDEEYLKKPIIQKALEFGFDLKAAIEAFEVCGNNEELALNYLCNNQNQ